MCNTKNDKSLPIILFVDDSPSFLKLVIKKFKDEFQVLTAYNGENALQLLENLSSLPEVIVADLAMPVMNGYKLIKNIRKEDKYCKIPFLFLSGREIMKYKMKGIVYGSIDFLEKSMSFVELKYKIKNILKIRNKNNKNIVDENYNLSKSNLENINYDNNFLNFLYRKRLSPCELKVALRLVNDEKYKEIAEKLSISEKTVSVLASRIYLKARVNNKQELIHLMRKTNEN